MVAVGFRVVIWVVDLVALRLAMGALTNRSNLCDFLQVAGQKVSVMSMRLMMIYLYCLAVLLNSQHRTLKT